MERIVVEMIEDIEVDIAKELIKQAASEMISSKVYWLSPLNLYFT